MYYPEEQVPDYQAEGVIPGEVVIKEDQLVLMNDRELEEGSIEFIEGKIEEGLTDLAEVTEINGLVTEAIANPSKQGNGAILNRAIRLRGRLEKRYGTMPGNFVLESAYHGSGLVLALEEEEKSEKGFFARIIDSITKAFKWLWSKITGLFKSESESGDKQHDAAREANDELKGKDDKIDQDKASDAMKSSLVLQAFGSAGPEVTPEIIIQALEKAIGLRERLAKIFSVSTQCFTLMTAFVKNEFAAGKFDESQAESLLSTIANTIASEASRLPNCSLEDLKKAGVISEGQTASEGTMHELTGFIANAGFYIWGEPTQGKAVLYNAKFKKGHVTAARSVKFPNEGERAAVLEKVDALLNAEAKTTADMAKNAERAESGTAALESALHEALEKAENATQAKVAADAIRKAAGCINKIASSAVTANMTISTTSAAALKYITDATKAAKENLKAGEPKKDGDK